MSLYSLSTETIPVELEVHYAGRGKPSLPLPLEIEFSLWDDLSDEALCLVDDSLEQLEPPADSKQETGTALLCGL